VPIRTHLRSVVIVPEIIGVVVGVYNGKYFYQVEIKPEMIGHYLAEFSASYKSFKGVGMIICSCFAGCFPKKLKVWSRNSY
jgi:ribosomal protein uS19